MRGSISAKDRKNKYSGIGIMSDNLIEIKLAKTAITDPRNINPPVAMHAIFSTIKKKSIRRYLCLMRITSLLPKLLILGTILSRSDKQFRKTRPVTVGRQTDRVNK